MDAGTDQRRITGVKYSFITATKFLNDNRLTTL
jgi:hypothetical protein